MDFLPNAPGAEAVPIPNTNYFKKYYVSSTLAEAAKDVPLAEAAGKPLDNFHVMGDYLFIAKDRRVLAGRIVEIVVDTGKVIGAYVALITCLRRFSHPRQLVK